MSSTTTPINRTGSCLCGSVKYTLTGPAITSMACHCYNCQKVTGSAFAANALFKKEHFQLDSSSTLQSYTDKAVDSGNVLERKFCGNCGSSVYLENTTVPAMKDNLVVMTGSIDGMKDTYAPKREFYPERRYKCLSLQRGNGKL